MLTGIEDNTSLTDVSSRDKTTPTSRRRKKVVTFASMAELAEIQALAACETDSQCSESGKTPALDETTLQALQDPRLFMNMPLEDYDATCGNVSTAVPKYCSRLLIEFSHKPLRQSDISFTVSLCYLSQGLFLGKNSKKFAWKVKHYFLCLFLLFEEFIRDHLSWAVQRKTFYMFDNH